MKLNILFILSKSQLNKKGKCPLRCRITYLNVRKQFASGQLVDSLNWNSKQQRVEPPEPDSQYINTQLSLIRQNLNQAFLFLQDSLEN